jgi:acid phosphatase (class A)
MKKNLLLIIFVALLMPQFAFAKPYFSAEIISTNLIDKPLKVNGAKWQKEIEYIINIQSKATKQQIENANYQRDLKPEMLYENASLNLNAEQKKQLGEFLNNVSETSYIVTKKFKEYFNTKRPYIADTKVKNLMQQPHDNPAYPSGHTSGAFVLAHTLTLIYPEKRDIFYKNAEEIAQNRVLAGMHFPHDVKGGKQLALIIIGGLLNDEEFKKD